MHARSGPSSILSPGHSYFDVFSPPSPLRHLWSLSIEEQFYLAWPLAVVAALATRRLAVVAAVAAGGLGASIAAMAARFDAADPSRAYYGTDTHAIGLLVGALLAVAGARWSLGGTGRLGRVRAVGGLVALAGVLAAFGLVDDRTPAVYRGGLAAFGVLTAVLVATAHGRTPVARLLGVPPLVATGRISYGLYLWHWPIWVLATPEVVGLDGLALDAARLATTFAVATASYVFLEAPIRRARTDTRSTLLLGPVAAGAVAATVLVATVRAVPLPEYYLAADARTPEAREVSLPGRRPLARASAKVAILGDSVAASLMPAFTRALGARGLRVVSAVLPGCGIATGEGVTAIERHRGEPGCARAVPTVLEQIVEQHDADLVVWLASRLEIGPRTVGERPWPFGTREADRAVAAALEDVRRALTRRGARIALLTLPAGGRRVNRRPDPVRERQVAHYNTLLRDFARAHADTVSLIDLAAVVCPDVPCPTMVEGRALRPDGVHFSRETAGWVVKRLLSDLTAAAAHAARATGRARVTSRASERTAPSEGG